MDYEELARILDPKNDDVIDRLSEAELKNLLYSMISMMGIQKEDFLKHVIRNLRRRLLYNLIPAKVIRLKNTKEQFMLEEEIVKTLSHALNISPQNAKKLTLKKLVRELAINLIESRKEHEFSTELEVIKKGKQRCQLCGYEFRYEDTKNARIKKLFSDEQYYSERYDGLKPMSLKKNLRKYAIDHIMPISSFGTNDISNLQLLCAQCNFGKDDYLTYSETRESSGFRQLMYIDKTELNSDHELMLFYAIIFRDKKCYNCKKGPNETELTISPINLPNFFIYDNLRAVCYDCDTYEQRWKKRN